MGFGNAAEYAIVMKLVDDVSGGLGKIGDKFGSLGSSISGAGKKLTAGVTLPLLGLGVVATKTAVDFESAFAGVIKTTDGLADNMGNLTDVGEEMKQGFRDLAKEVPVAFEELAQIGELGGQLGIARDGLLDFTETIAAMGVSTNLTTEAAAVGFAQIANVMKTPQANIERLGSSIVDLGNNFATTESDILNFAQNIAGAGKIAGITEADVLGISAAFSSVGVEAAAGGTAVQKVLLSMTQAVAEGGEKLEAFAAASGMTVDEFSERWESDAAGVFTSFVETLGASGDQAINTLSDLGLQDQRLIRSFLSLAGAGDLLDEAIGRSNDAWVENTALSKEAEARYRTTESQMTILKNTLADAAATIGDVLLPVVNDIVDSLKPWIDRLTELDPKALQMGVTIAGIAAAVGPLLIALGSLISIGGTLIATVFSPIGLIIGGVALALAGLKLAFDNNILGFKDFVGGIQERLPTLEDLKATFDSVVEKITLLVNAFQDAGPGSIEFQEALAGIFGEDFADTVQVIIEKLTEFGEWFGTALENIGPFIEAIQNFGLFSEETGNIIEEVFGSKVAEVFTQFGEVFTQVWETIQTVIETAWEIIQPAIEQLWTGIVAAFENIGPVVEEFQALWTALGPFVAAVAGLIGGVIATVLGVVVSLFAGIANAIQPFITTVLGVIQGLAQMFRGLVEMITGFLEIIWGAISGNQDLITRGTEKFLNGVTNLWEGLKKSVVSLVTGLVDTVVKLVEGFYNSIVQWFTDLYDKIVGRSIISDLVDGVIGAFEDMALDVIKGIEQFVKDVLSWFTDLYDDALETVKGFIDIGKAIVEGIREGINKAWDTFTGWLHDQLNKMPELVKKWLGISSPSKIFAEIGANLIEGLNQGMEDKWGEHLDDWQALGESIAATVAMGIEAGKLDLDEAWQAMINEFGEKNIPMTREQFESFGEQIIIGLENSMGRQFVKIGDKWYEWLEEGFLKPLDDALNKSNKIVSKWSESFFGEGPWNPEPIPGQPPKPPEETPPEEPLPPYPEPPGFEQPPPEWQPPEGAIPLMGSNGTIYNIYPTYGAYSDEITLAQDIKMMQMLAR